MQWYWRLCVHCSLHCSCMIWLHMKHCSIGKVHAPKAQEHEYVLQRSSLVWLGLPTRTTWCFWCGESIPAFVYPMLGGGQHAVWDQMKLIGKPNYHLTHIQPLLSQFTLTFNKKSYCKLHAFGQSTGSKSVNIVVNLLTINFSSKFLSSCFMMYGQP